VRRSRPRGRGEGLSSRLRTEESSLSYKQELEQGAGEGNLSPYGGHLRREALRSMTTKEGGGTPAIFFYRSDTTNSRSKVTTL